MIGIAIRRLMIRLQPLPKIGYFEFDPTVTAELLYLIVQVNQASEKIISLVDATPTPLEKLLACGAADILHVRAVQREDLGNFQGSCDCKMFCSRRDKRVYYTPKLIDFDQIGIHFPGCHLLFSKGHCSKRRVQRVARDLNNVANYGETSEQMSVIGRLVVPLLCGLVGFAVPSMLISRQMIGAKDCGDGADCLHPRRPGGGVKASPFVNFHKCVDAFMNRI